MGRRETTLTVIDEARGWAGERVALADARTLSRVAGERLV
jgi:hypothetical protein